MKYVLYKDGAQVLKNQMGAYAQEEHDEKEEQNMNNDNGFEAMFETPRLVSSLEKASTSTWLTRIESRLAWLEMNVHHIREIQSYIVDTFLSFAI